MGKGEGKGSSIFSEEQLTMYKECFKLMDIDKDGVINKVDLRAAFDNVGRLMSDPELDDMLSEIGGVCNFDNMIKCFEKKMAGDVNDPDAVIVEGIKSFDDEMVETVKGVTIVKHLIDPEQFRHDMMTFGDKMTQEEMDDIFGEFEFDDDGFILTGSVVDLFVAGGMEAKEDDKKEKAAAAAADGGAGGAGGGEDADADFGSSEGGKKKKKKKKAAK